LATAKVREKGLKVREKETGGEAASKEITWGAKGTGLWFIPVYQEQEEVGVARKVGKYLLLQIEQVRDLSSQRRREGKAKLARKLGNMVHEPRPPG